MANGLGHLWRRLSSLSGAPGVRDESDGALLRRYVEGRDEAAFEVLLRRHAGMVFGVCRRVLRDRDATEDAFQATFLLLVRKAHSIRRLDALACWLHGVAYRVAVRAKANERRRRGHEREAATKDAHAVATSEAWEVRPVLDQELARLPEKYRAPLVLCYLQGKTNDEAARQLRWPSGTVKSRLARAREMLRERLRRRGLALTVGALGTLLAEETAAAPAGWLTTTMRAAVLWTTGRAAAGAFSANVVALTEGVMRSMFLNKITSAGILLLGALLVVGASAGAYRVWAGGRSPAVEQTPAADEDVARLIRQLGSDDFEQRERAAAKLAAIGEPALAALKKAATSNDAEVRRRAEDLIAGIERKLYGEAADLRGPDGHQVWGVAFSPDGKRLLSSGTDRTLRLWDVEKHKEVRALTGHEDVVTGVAWSADGKVVASVSFDGTMRLWDLDAGKETKSFEAGQTHEGVTEGVAALALSADGKRMLTNTRLIGDGVRVWDVEAGKELRKLPHPGRGVYTVAISADGTKGATSREDHRVLLWDLDAGKQLRTLAGHDDLVSGLAFSADGKRLLSGSSDGTLRLWDLATGKELRKMEAGKTDVLCVALSPDGKRAVSGGRDHTVRHDCSVRLWDVETGKLLRRYESHTAEINAVAFSSDGKYIASGSLDQTIRLWPAGK